MASDRRYRFIRPRFYRYRVADPGLRATVNNYTGERPIGLTFVVGSHAYCVLWAKTRAKTLWEHAEEVIRDATKDVRSGE